MKRTCVVIGAGVGGLAAAIRLALDGASVTVCEASPFFGGLASSLDVDGTRFDGGPYILLDPDGLAHAFRGLGISMADLALRPVESVYEVEREHAPPLIVHRSLEHTVEAWERAMPGQGLRYRAFVGEMTAVHRALAPLQRGGRPSPLSLIRHGALRQAPFLLRSLGAVLNRAGLLGAARDAVGIWTHIAGQPLEGAPSPLALVPAMIHGPGCFVPERGVAAVTDAVIARAREVGVTLRASCPVARIVVREGRARGVVLESGEHLEADQVVSNASGVETLLTLAPAPPRMRRALAQLPLQSPGVAAYGFERPSEAHPAPYLRFRLHPEDADAPCRLVVRPWALETARSERMPVRIALPLSHPVAERLGRGGQEALLDRVLSEPWIRARVTDFDPRHRLVPSTWGERHRLHRHSMNPVMTAAFMRRGRLPHRAPHVDGLYLVGSSTHPGQWVSFCLLSGLIGAEEARRAR